PRASRHPDRPPAIADAEPESAELQRDWLAAQATRDTHLSTAGLTPAAESFLYGLTVTTVGGLLDYSQRRFVNAPGLGAKTRSEIEMVRLLLRLPDERGTLPDIGVWPKQKDVAVALQLSVGRIPQLLRAQRVRWRKLPAVRALREEILELLAGLGRIASAAEI